MNTYQLKVTLRGCEPPIWRRVLVPGNLNLQRLHRVIQDAMGWTDCHLHSFEVHGETYGVPDQGGWGRKVHSEKQFTLERLLREKDRIRYTYDFGDNWEHEVLVESVVEGGEATPRCIDGARACPPDDCGGVWGYAEFVAAVADTEHPRHEETLEWVPEGWSSETFDVALADRLVATHRPEPGKARSTKGGAGARARSRLRP